MNIEHLRNTKHYNQAEVLKAIAPAKTFTDYLQNLSWSSATEVVVEFGKHSGQIVPKSNTILGTHDQGYTIVHKDDVLKFCREIQAVSNTESLLQSYTERHLFACDSTIPDGGTLRSLDDLVITVHNTIALQQHCRLLDEEFYGDNSFCHTSVATQNLNGEYICTNDAIYTAHGYYMHEEDENLRYNHYHSYHVNLEDDDTVYNIDDEEWALGSDSIYWCGEWYRQRPYNDKEVIHEYHRGPSPEVFTQDDDSRLSKWTIGFEVEKTAVNGESSSGEPVDDEPLFAHWETDASCGVEGITNVYGLNMWDKFKADVDQSYLLDEPCDHRCGGHINFAHRDNVIDVWHIKPWLGLMWSMYRRRLTQEYCSRNKKANPYDCKNSHYGTIVEKTCSTGKMFELRVPRRVSSRQVLLRRFGLMQNLITCIDKFANEEFDHTKAKYDDQVKGKPNWLPDTNQKVDWCVIEHIPEPTYRRMRYLIEISKRKLLEAYQDNTAGLIEAVFFAYIFQAYIDLPVPPRELTCYIERFIYN